MASSGQNGPPNTPLRPVLFNISTPAHVPWNTPGTGVSNYYSAPFSPTPASHEGRATPGTSAPVKRKYLGKENNSLNTDPKKRRKKQALTNSDKVQLFHGFIKTELQWSYSEAIFYTSQATSNFDFDSTSLSNNDPRSQKWGASRESITATLQHFYNGRTEHPPAKILHSWFTHPYGRHERESVDMYSTHTPYTELKPVRVALSSFAMQTILNKAVREVEAAIATTSGLHLSHLSIVDDADDESE
ncbi:hypothetical protein HYPSUDRAFT_801622 [Hypholoma sublateritium FD-334 SS-4]|uniref:Uncharacterized protein n=1 Tax=Hypholoma sublateritium (strain FD-334 SS-4) TaxID=945553 RepID=A0A0D2MVV6_HYPSF|nr:hypothetical protein HYPSUDRAFT_801622 [Hypholoma sublateritium FD-334 SS-4]